MATVFNDTGKAVTSAAVVAYASVPKYIGWGTAAGTAAAGDTTLFTEKDVDLATGSGTRTTGTPSQVTTTVTNDTVQIVGTRTATGAGTVTNAGCFDNASIGSGNIYMKGDFTGIPLGVGDAIQFTFKLKYA